MTENILINGKAEDLISSQDRGLQYGDGVFETIAVSKNQFHCWDEHITRLNQGCERLVLSTPDVTTLINEARSLINNSERGVTKSIFSVLAIRDQVAPPTINLDEPDSECDLDYVPHTAREMKIDIALSNSFGFGGTNGSLIFKKLP